MASRGTDREKRCGRGSSKGGINRFPQERGKGLDAATYLRRKSGLRRGVAERYVEGGE